MKLNYKKKVTTFRQKESTKLGKNIRFSVWLPSSPSQHPHHGTLRAPSTFPTPQKPRARAGHRRDTLPFRAAGCAGKWSPRSGRRPLARPEPRGVLGNVVRERRGACAVGVGMVCCHGNGAVVVEWGEGGCCCLGPRGHSQRSRGPGVHRCQCQGQGVCRFQGSWGIMSLVTIPRQSRGLGGSGGATARARGFTGTRGPGVLGVQRPTGPTARPKGSRGLGGPWASWSFPGVEGSQGSMAPLPGPGYSQG